MTALDPRALRKAFGSFMTGVTIVTARDRDGQPVGFTANSFSSVSLDPPLLLVCPGKFLSNYLAFTGCEKFAVNILAEGQEDVANTFSSYKGDRFARVAHRTDALDNILIDGALTQFSCKTYDCIEAGDHTILIGEVKAFSHATRRGLGYAGGQYCSLGLERAALEHSGKSVLAGAIIAKGDTVLLEPTAAGFRLPHVLTTNYGQLRKSLAQSLEERGQPVRLGPAYSVFEDGKTDCAYFLAKAPKKLCSALDAVPIDSISTLTFASRSIADMMSRFALESQTRSFGLYIGDAARGDVLHQTEGA